MRNYTFYVWNILLIFLIINPVSVNSQDPSPKSHEIIIQDFAFLPSELKVNIGDAVTFKWANKTGSHNVEQVSSSSDTSYNDGFRSGDPQKGPAEWIVPSSYLQTNTTLYYICDPHVVSHNMRGKIIVGNDMSEDTSGGNIGLILAIFAGSGVITIAAILILQKKKKSV